MKKITASLLSLAMILSALSFAPAAFAADDEIYVLMNKIVAEGGAVIMISSELPEVLNMSNRVLVVCDGRITGEFNPEIDSAEAIMDKAIG